MQGPTKTYSSIDEAGKAIKLAHEQCTDMNEDGSLKTSSRTRLAANETSEVATKIYALYNDITADLDQFKSLLTTHGLSRSSELAKNLTNYCEGMKAILEEEMATHR